MNTLFHRKEKILTVMQNTGESSGRALIWYTGKFPSDLILDIDVYLGTRFYQFEGRVLLYSLYNIPYFLVFVGGLTVFLGTNCCQVKLSD